MEKMAARVTLSVTEGDLGDRDFVFTEPASCIVGRAHDCHPRLPDDEGHRTVSRHHCLLDINPPDAGVRDFGNDKGEDL